MAHTELTLLLKTNNICSEGTIAIANALQSGKAPTRLTLDLSNNNLDKDCITAVANALQSGNAPIGLALNLEHNDLCQDSISTIVNALQSGRTPKSLTLDLSLNYLSEDNITTIASALQSGNAPEGLTLGLGMSGLDSVNVVAIANALQSGRAPKGLTLKLISNNLGPDTTAIANALQSGSAPVELTLDLSYTNLSQDSFNTITNALQSGNAPVGLTLDLGYNYLGQNAATILANALQSGSAPTGLTLNLTYNSLGQVGATAIANALQSNNIPAGLMLDLTSNEFYQTGITTLINATMALPLSKRYQWHIKVSDNKAQHKLNTLCYFEPLIWPSLIFRCMWATAPDDHLLKKLPLELVHQILSHVMDSHHLYQKSIVRKIETIWTRIDELRYIHPRNYISYSIPVNTISSWSFLGGMLYMKGYLATVKTLKPSQYRPVPIRIKELASRQIINAIASTLAEYRAIWKHSDKKESKKKPFRQLSECLKTIKQENKSLEMIVNDILLFFQRGSAHWHAGKKMTETGNYDPSNGPSIKVLLMKKLLTISLFDRKINNDGTLALITETELEQGGLKYTLDLTQDKFGGCHIPGLICFFENECKRVAGLKKPAIREEKQQPSLP